MARIRDVEPKYAYRMLVELDSGNVIYLNMSDKIDTMRFNDLKDESVFQDVTTDGDSVLWAGGRISLSLSEIFDMTRVNSDRDRIKDTKVI